MTKAKKTTAKTEREKFEQLCVEATDKRSQNSELRQACKDNRTLAATLRQKLIEDLKRVFNHPCNPYRGWAASRARYRQLGWYPEILVIDAFGNHQEFQRAADLRDSRGTTKVKNLTARLATEQKIREYAEAHVLNHVGKFGNRLQNMKGLKQMIVLSDLHSYHLDPFAWQMAQDILEEVQPDVITFNGDVVDFPKVGRYTDMPGATNLNLQREIDFARKEIFARARKLCPDAVMTWHIGNHEQRLIRYMADCSPLLAELKLPDGSPCISFERLFGVEEFGLEMVFGGTFMSPRQKDRKDDVKKKTWKIYYDSYAVTHGKSTARHPAAEEARRFGISGTSGHTHRPNLISHPTAVCPTATWMSTGMLAGFSVGQHFVDGPSAWLMGFGYAVIDPSSRSVIQTPIIIHEDFATFAGRVWRPTQAAIQKRATMWD